MLYAVAVSHTPDHREIYLLVGGLIAGMLLGPAVLGRWQPDLHGRWFPSVDAAQQHFAAEMTAHDQQARALEALAEAGRIDGAELLDHVQRPPVSKQTRVRLRRARHHRGRMYALILAIFTVMIIETVVVTRRQGLMRARYALAAVFIALLLAQPAVLAGFSPAFLLLLLAVALLAAWMPTTKPNP